MAASLAASPHPPPLQLPSLRLRCPLLRSRFQNRRRRFSSTSRNGLRAVPYNRIAVAQVRGEEVEESSSNVVDADNWNGKGSGFGYNGSVGGSNGSVMGTLNGSGASNGSVLKYVNGNGAAAKMADVIPIGKLEEEKRKKKVEEIGQEEAWFKRVGKEKLEVETTRSSNLLSLDSFEIVVAVVTLSVSTRRLLFSLPPPPLLS